MEQQLPRLYKEFAEWFHLLTAPEDYASESDFYLEAFATAIGHKPETLLELGSGGGNMASHYKRDVAATLVDLSPSMLAVSSQLNPECEHLAGDMRTIRLGRTFDAVLVHDAVCYLRTLDDLQSAFSTAFVHCKPGGAALFAPDYTRENFKARTEHGGHDCSDRSLRYLEWTTDPDPSDSTYVSEFAYLLRQRGQPTRVELDTHICGLFSEAQWLGGLEQAGFRQVSAMPGPEDPSWAYTIFVAEKRLP
jgi:SAM-dependent methyltransferase